MKSMHGHLLYFMKVFTFEETCSFLNCGLCLCFRLVLRDVVEVNQSMHGRSEFVSSLKDVCLRYAGLMWSLLFN